MRRRIDVFFETSTSPSFRFSITPIKETESYFIIKDLIYDHKGFKFYHKNGQITIRKRVTSKKDFAVSPYTWKPHEYRQEARKSCLITYWIFKKLLGRDIAGIIAKFVWSTRFDYCWENEEED